MAYITGWQPEKMILYILPVVEFSRICKR